MKKFILALAVFASFGMSSSVIAHSGGTNANGCHNETRTGGYHCH